MQRTFRYASKFIDLEVANHNTAAVSRRYPDKFIPFTVIDNKPGYWTANGVKGFKEHVYGQRILRDDKGEETFAQDFKETYAYIEKHRVPLLLHAGNNRVQRLRQDIFIDTPDLLVILAHLGADFPKDNNLVGDTVEWLMENQRPDGSFAPWKTHPAASDVFCTSVAVLGLLQYNESIPPETFEKSYNWLLSSRLPNGIWPYHEIEDGAFWGLYALTQLLNHNLVSNG